jgi:hypothetical protein
MIGEILRQAFMLFFTASDWQTLRGGQKNQLEVI